MRSLGGMVNVLCRVGKTELCKALAAYLFDTEDALVGACLFFAREISSEL